MMFSNDVSTVQHHGLFNLGQSRIELFNGVGKLYVQIPHEQKRQHRKPNTVNEGHQDLHPIGDDRWTDVIYIHQSYLLPIKWNALVRLLTMRGRGHRAGFNGYRPGTNCGTTRNTQVRAAAVAAEKHLACGAWR